MIVRILVELDDERLAEHVERYWADLGVELPCPSPEEFVVEGVRLAVEEELTNALSRWPDLFGMRLTVEGPVTA